MKKDSEDSRSTPGSNGWVDALPPQFAVRVRSLALAGIFFLMVMYTLYFAASLFIPIVLAMLLSLVLSPLVRFLAALHVPKILGAVVVMATIIGLLMAAAYSLMEPASKWLEDAPHELRRLEYQLAWVKRPMENISEAGEQIKEMTDVDGEEGEAEKAAPEKSSNSLMNAIQNRTPEALFGLAVTMILLFFLLASGDAFLAKMVEVTPRLEDKKRVVHTAREIQHHISLYLGTITVINIVLGASIALALYLLDVPNPALWGVMVGVLNFIPYLGVAISILVVTLVSLLTFSSPAQIFLPGLVIFLANVIEGQVLTPLITGHKLALSPVAVFLSLVVLGWIWGLIGVLIAVPILVCVKLVCDESEMLKPVATFLSHHR